VGVTGDRFDFPLDAADGIARELLREETADVSGRVGCSVA